MFFMSPRVGRIVGHGMPKRPTCMRMGRIVHGNRFPSHLPAQMGTKFVLQPVFCKWGWLGRGARHLEDSGYIFLMRLDFDTVLVDHQELRTCSIYVGEMPASLYDSQAELIFLSTGVRFARCFGWAS